MGLVERFGRMQSCGKQHWRSLFWRIRAAMKKKAGLGDKFKFQYDPYSYALNFDDGFQFHQEMAGRKWEFHQPKFLGCPDEMKAIWVYVLWLE